MLPGVVFVCERLGRTENLGKMHGLRWYDVIVA